MPHKSFSSVKRKAKERHLRRRKEAQSFPLLSSKGFELLRSERREERIAEKSW